MRIIERNFLKQTVTNCFSIHWLEWRWCSVMIVLIILVRYGFLKQTVGILVKQTFLIIYLFA